MIKTNETRLNSTVKRITERMLFLKQPKAVTLVETKEEKGNQ